ncbi:EAL domain-containing protein [Marinobacter fonticola]|uniref:EAL domain-containing protein n=1 Tax=Marinobacter fonticola TaxID=2603215 RepID=UPI0011E7AD6A|nr:EAL domain-containing protein [Marinobacter fonticola]
MAEFPPMSLRLRYRVWLPLLLFFAIGAYCLSLNLAPAEGFEHASPLMSQPPPKSLQPNIRFRTESLERTLRHRSWMDDQGWLPMEIHGAGLGYLDTPVTFQVELTNASVHSLSLLLRIQAPSLDQVRAVALGDAGEIERLPTLGDTFPFAERMVALPELIWPVTLSPSSDSTFLFEVVNAGPTLFPFAATPPEQLLSQIGGEIVWKAGLYGLLLFALIFDLALLLTLRSMAAAWLTCLLGTVLVVQLCLDGFGLWLLWPQWPAMNNLLTPMLPLGAIALLGFSRHFLGLGRRARRVFCLASMPLLAVAVLAPLHVPGVGQVTALVGASAAPLLVLGVALFHTRENPQARYLALALVLLLSGSAIAMLRTIGWVPVNAVTTSGYYLGTAAAAVFLTLVVGYRLLEERRQRVSATQKVAEERQLRTRLEQDYDRLMASHPVSRRPNRPIMEQTLDQLIQSGQSFVVGLLRLERYGEIERALGYQEAENLLRVYLTRFCRYLEGQFPEQLVLFQGHALGTVDTANHVIALRTDYGSLPWNVIRQWLEQPFSEDHYAFSWRSKLGLAYAPEHGSGGSQLISRAGFASVATDTAINVYDPRSEEEQNLQHFLILDLDRALRTGSIYLAYQPKVCLRDSRVIAYEALIRWNHPDYGPIRPDQWIPFAEHVGAIHGVTLWAIERAVQDLSALERQAGRPVPVAVNISARDLARADFHTEALGILARHNVTPNNMILEITETAVMRNTDQARQMLEKLNRAGFRIALDDFGTGYSSLSALASFNLDELKIDRNFLTDIPSNDIRQRIFHTAVELGDALNLRIVVEGVETEAVANWLQRYPGLCGQGYYWGRPEPLSTL